MKLQATLKGAAAPAALAFAFLAQPAFAQADPAAPPAETPARAAADDTSDAIIVTGSRIRREGFDTTQPTVVIGSDTFENLGLTNVGDALDMIPAFGPPAGSPVGAQAGSFGSGQTFVDFFGLGSQRTLTLLDGKRFVSSNTASIFGPVDAGSQVDLNTIPALMVDRVETVAVGGAPIYGADAIAGTVNIILKDKFEGIKLDGQFGIADKGDAEQYRIAGMVGTSFAGGRGNILAAAEYNKTQGLLYTDRAATARGLFFAAPVPTDPPYPYSNQLIYDRHINIMSEYGIPMSEDFVPGFGVGVYNQQGQELAFDKSGNLIPIDFGTKTGSIVNYSGGNGLSLTPLSNLLTPVERYLGTIRANYEISDGITAYADFNYAHSKGTNLRDQPVYNTALFGDGGDPDGNLIIPLSNPFLTDEARATIAASLPAGQDFFYLGRANTDLVSGRGSATVELYRIVGGLKGDLSFGERHFDWDISGNYGRSKTVGSSRELVQQNFENALAGCPSGAENSPIATISSTCAPFNPFGQQNSQAVADYITTIADPTAINKQWVVSANLSGDLFSIWSGEVSIALGYEHRNESSDFDPGAFFYGAVDPDDPTAPRSQYGRSIPIDAVHGSYNTDEFYGELRIPLISRDMGIPLIDSLEFDGAARYVDNSLTGGDWTWTAGGRWGVTEDLTFRGNFTRSIRAPAITELFNPTSQIFTTADDPCDARFIDSGPNPANRAANCAAAGVPTNFTSNIVDFTTEGSLSGNTGLQNEVADSWTIGAVITPRFLPGFSLSADWVDISLKNAILSVDAEQTLEACYDAPSYPTSACGQIDRGADSQVDFIRTGYLNAASYDYQGLIAEMVYRFDLGSSTRATLRASYQYIDKLEQRVGEGDLATQRGGIGYSKHQATASALVQSGPIDFYVQAQYFGKAVIDPDAEPSAYDYYTISPTTIINTSIGAKVTDNVQLRFIVENLFDNDPPFPIPAGGGVVTYFDEVMGRYFKLNATVTF